MEFIISAGIENLLVRSDVSISDVTEAVLN